MSSGDIRYEYAFQVTLTKTLITNGDKGEPRTLRSFTLVCPEECKIQDAIDTFTSICDVISDEVSSTVLTIGREALESLISADVRQFHELLEEFRNDEKEKE